MDATGRGAPNEPDKHRDDSHQHRFAGICLFYLMIIVSFKTNTPFYQAPAALAHPLHPENWIEAWQTITPTLANSVFLSVSSVLLMLFMALSAAYLFARLRMPLSSFMWNAILILMMLPMIANLVPLFRLIRDMNLLNTLTALILVGAADGRLRHGLGPDHHSLHLLDETLRARYDRRRGEGIAQPYKTISVRGLTTIELRRVSCECFVVQSERVSEWRLSNRLSRAALGRNPHNSVKFQVGASPRRRTAAGSFRMETLAGELGRKTISVRELTTIELQRLRSLTL